MWQSVTFCYLRCLKIHMSFGIQFYLYLAQLATILQYYMRGDGGEIEGQNGLCYAAVLERYLPDADSR